MRSCLPGPDRARRQAGSRVAGAAGSEAVLREILQRVTESRKRLFEIVAEKGRADQIIGRPRVSAGSRLGQRLSPFSGVEIAAADPHQRQELCFLVVVEQI